MPTRSKSAELTLSQIETAEFLIMGLSQPIQSLGLIYLMIRIEAIVSKILHNGARL